MKLKIRSIPFWKSNLVTVLALVMVYFIGVQVGEATEAIHTNGRIVEETKNWGLGFGESGTVPSGNSSSEELAQYHAYYVDQKCGEDKVLYLTFDAGFENGNTEKILDALKKHEAPATFFVVGNYLESSPELVKRMVAEGHTVGNHSYHHPDMTEKSDTEFQEELHRLEGKFEEITGEKLAKFYRPPQGKYNDRNLKLAYEMGYKTIFWSLAYVDWIQENQPTQEEAFDKLLSRVHPGAIVLLHNTSQTNGEILDELLSQWETMGYRFERLENLD